MANDVGRGGDLVLAPGEYAYVLDTTKGLVTIWYGPAKTSMSNTDQTVLWDKAIRRFVRCEPEKAIQTDTIAPEGFYVALLNPAEKHPEEGRPSVAATLTIGHRVNLPGPVHFALWPGQMAEVLRGHHLRSNQYLLAEVYNDVEATRNWKSAVVKPAEPPKPPSADGKAPEPTVSVAPLTFTPGQQLIIKGTDVAFFIPPTGIKVVPEDGAFVREAVTLERLEYCILLDEDGNKRFVQGPDVVFPEPTEKFVEKAENGTMVRKFRAIELNETTGIYVKVIADYKDGDKQHHAGDELFITGKEQAIYFQREEHSVIRYGEQTKHYAVAVPAGEGRYVLDRNKGRIALERGPQMLLCDPRSQVIVRRVVADKTLALWYPGNAKVIEVNRALEAMTATTDASAYQPGRAAYASSLSLLNAADELAVKSSRQIAGETFNRGTTFTPPRTITLDTKYEGAVSLAIWTGYAVLVINKQGDRRVVVGPENVLLEYDETLAPLELSTGKPKNDAAPFRTVYLLVHNNKVSDKITVETKDLVSLELTVSYRVNFEGDDREQWFAVENYVKLLTDHLRSRIRNVTKRKGIEEFYGNAVDIVRDATLGAAVDGQRPGLPFAENGMRVYDIEILDVSIKTPNVAQLLGTAQKEALETALRLAKEERELEAARRSDGFKRQTEQMKAETATLLATFSKTSLAATLDLELTRIANEARTAEERYARQIEEQTALNTLNDADIARQQATDAQRLQTKKDEVALELSRVLGETEEIVKRAGAVSPALAAALTTFADNALVERITATLAPMAAMSGMSGADVLAGLFKGTPMADVMASLATRTKMLA